ncbi:uncharacterized protein LOC114164430 [Vigna unguiculata]|uniref:Transmembrane protein n=1 Tax=Vigna unguiculata TaxID=3917 RepID=A0A4D6NUI6_VIGUN|nr:uncharacterized protein LOC114164430 [Vigna unguiculata]QCE16354.1 hypothetical protein DEO72_LG11g3368 [Vigna unguiculata]
MEVGGCRRGSRFSSYERLAAIGLVLLAVASPLYIDRKAECELEEEDQPINVDAFLPFLLLLLIFGIALSAFLDRTLAAFDRYWIYRVIGSSGGILALLSLLLLILNLKSSL